MCGDDDATRPFARPGDDIPRPVERTVSRETPFGDALVGWSSELSAEAAPVAVQGSCTATWMTNLASRHRDSTMPAPDVSAHDA